MLLSANEIALFLAFAGLTGLVLWLLLRPLRADAAAAPQDVGESEIAIYRDQLAEIGRDLERGTIGEAEAEAARVEVSRRLIAAGEAGRSRAQPTQPSTHAGAARPQSRLRSACHADAFHLSAPRPEGQPIEARLTPHELPVEALIRIERRLKTRTARRETLRLPM